MQPSPRSTRRLAIPILLGGLLASCGGGDGPAGRGGAGRPGWSAVLVTLDTTRADHLGCYGHGGDLTPSLDALADEGSLFELCISSAAVTPVSHASILTGQHPYTHGLRVMFARSGFRLGEQCDTLPEILKEAGFRTGAFLSAYPVSEDFGLERGFDAFDWPGSGEEDQGMSLSEGGTTASWDVGQLQRRSDRTTDRAIAWIDEQGDQPFFLWLHYWDPHDPNKVPPADFLERFLPGVTQILPGMRDRLYEAEVAYVDREFGRLVEHLKGIGRFEDTVFAVTADHGEGLGEHGWHAHRILYQEQIHLPLIVRYPGGARGRRVADLVRAIDIQPTVLELLDLPPPGRVEGRSLVGLMEGRPEEPRLAYAEQLNRWDANAKMVEKRPQDALLHSVMDRSWKLIYRPEDPGRSELYNIEEDPEESRNLYRQRPEVRARLEAELERLEESFGIWVREPFPEVEGGVLPNEKALRALGYLGDD